MKNFLLFCAALFLAALPRSAANLPGGGTGTGANVTLTDSGTVVTLNNGIVSIPITKASANINSIGYTHSNGTATVTTQMLSGGYNGGVFYWEFGGFGDGGTYTCSVVADPLHPTGSNAVGDYAEVAILRGGAATGAVDMHFSMRRGSPGFYVAPIWIHGSADPAMGMGETRTNIYAGSIFNWMSVDAARNRQMQTGSGNTAVAVDTAPKEVSLWTNGVYQGQYEDKYKYSADFGTQRVWGWSSVTTANPVFTGSNVGLWDVLASAEYYNGGPGKRELMSHIGTTILNMFNGSHYGGGTDTGFAAGEDWSKVYGPYFVYCNSVPGNAADPANALFNDAQAQAAAEAAAWPYAWFGNARYTPAAGRGTVTGRMVVNDSGNPNASAGGLWVGAVQQPATLNGVYDFQKWAKPYQFWVRADAGGNFTIPNVIAGTNYTLFAFGAGAAGTFQSQALTGGGAPLTTNVAAQPFGVAVAGGGTTALGDVTWIPTRVGQTVFEIGVPDRNSLEFRHGDDYWVSDKGPSAAAPSPVWSKHLDYPIDFPGGVNYTVGASRWATDWNYVQPAVLNSAGGYNASTSTINFNLANTPNAGAAAASLYVAQASNYQGPVIVTVNGTNLGSVATTGTPNAVGSTGYFAAWSGSGDGSDTTIREGPHGCYSDERITFAGSLLKKGANVITLQMRKADYFANHAMYDYLRLELAGYVPPAPVSVVAYAGNASALVSWPTVPGATSYNILRSTVSGSGYAGVASGIVGPVSGSGPTNAVYVDATAVNGTTYYYVVQAVNPAGASVNSAQSAGVAPSAGAATAAPGVPTGLTATAAGGSVTLNWTAPAGANYFTVKRSLLVGNSGGSSVVTLGTITLGNGVTGTSYTDGSVSNGSLYAYTVSATNAAGTGGESAAASAAPLAAAPAAGPASLTAAALQNASAGGIELDWPAVAGAAGYVVQRAASSGGTYVFLDSVTPLTYTDGALAANTAYYYRVAAINSGGVSPFVSASATTPPAAPATLTATAAPSRVTLNWAASGGAVSYVIGRATVSGGAYATIAGAASGTNYVDRTVVNGVAYFYVVSATGAGGTGAASTEASAMPVGPLAVVWTGSAGSVWDTSTVNWTSGGTARAYADGNAVVFDDSAAGSTVAISGTPSPDSVLFNDSVLNYSFNAAGLSGAAGLSKLGSGTLNITGTNTFTGGTTISGGGAVVINGGTGNAQNGLGTGTVSLQGGTLTMNGYSGSNTSSYGVLANALDVPGGATGTLQVTQRGGQSGAVTGAGTLNLQVNYIRGDVSGDWSGFTGRVNVLRTRTGMTVDNFRINAGTGFGVAAVNLGPYVQASTPLNASNSFIIGELSSSDATGQLAGIIFNNNTPGSYTAAYVVGGRNTNAAFAGSIVNGGSPSVTAVTKVGSGVWTLAGACTYTGATAVSGGALRVTGSVVGSSGLTVAAGALLDVAGGRVAVSGAVVNNGTVRVSGAGAISSTGGFTNNGVLDLINGAAGSVGGIGGMGGMAGNFVNNGSVLDSSAVKVQGVGVSGADFVLTIQGYAGHSYQLQRSAGLAGAGWVNAGAAQSGAGAALVFVDQGALGSGSGGNGGAGFYRVAVSAQ